MAYVTNITSHLPNSLAALVATLVADYKARAARRRVFNQTYRELSALSGRELADLGLNRTEIRRVAYEAAYEM